MAQGEIPVYRVVDGKLVRVPGDVRDSKRRYSQTTNVQTGETYLREFTDEEERQADAQAAAWEAERPQREAEEKRREEEAQRFRESLRYESRIVAFLDVLGWSEAIAASTTSVELTQKLGITLQGLGAHVAMNSWQRQHAGPHGWPGNPMMTQFSDTLLISFSADRHAKIYLEMTLSAVTVGLMFNGFIARGAVSFGPLIHRESLAYGPALVAAYRLEKEVAKMPRVILDPILAQAWSQGERVQDRHGALIGYQKFWRQDEDGWFFFDHLSNPYGIPTIFHRGEPNSALQQSMAKWREFIVQRLAENRGSPSVLRKYVWLSRYFDLVCAENKADYLEPISFQET